MNELLEKFEQTKSYDTLNEEQKKFFELFFTGQNIFLSGGGGVGKSYCLRVLFEFCDANHIGISKTASTGGAAINIGGSTIHSWAGIGIADKNIESIIKDAQKSKKAGLIKSCKILVIDEVSMLSKRILTIIDIVMRKIRNSDSPFGGVQLLLTGDFCQLPPIGKEDDGAYAFESMSWVLSNIKTHILTESVRQKEKFFSEVLREIRMGDYKNLEILKTRLNKEVISDFKPLRIFPLRKDADLVNSEEMSLLKVKEHRFNADEWGKDNHLKFFESNCQARKTITLKIGAQVCLVSNISVDDGLVNGSFGKIVDFSNETGYPVVDFNNTIKEIEPIKFEIKEEKNGGLEYKVVACRKQIPLRLAWAGTSHSCQGITTDAIEVDLNRVFGYGMGYVMVSRCKTLEGMNLICNPSAFGPKKFIQNPKALDFYRNL